MKVLLFASLGAACGLSTVLAKDVPVVGPAKGTLVIEAPRASGALITARLAVESHGREVLALPGRADSPASAGCLDLIRKGEAGLAVEPKDVLDALESPARHAHFGTFRDRYAHTNGAAPPPKLQKAPPASLVDLSPEQERIVEALSDAPGLEALSRAVDLPVERLVSELTLLEIKRVVERRGAGFVRTRA